MDGYQKLKEIVMLETINEDAFDRLCIGFEESYLVDWRYEDRLRYHPNPKRLKQELQTDLNVYLLKIQGREEMRDIDKQKIHWLRSGKN